MPAQPVLRKCLACGQEDDHPRHGLILQVAPELIVAEMHLDCCAQVRGCESCAAQVAGADGKTGDAMRAHIVNYHAEQGATA